MNSNILLYSGTNSIQKEKTSTSEFIELKNSSWKSMYNLLNMIKKKWCSSNLDYQNFCKFLFSKLKSCQPNLNDINSNDKKTEYQKILSKFLYEEQKLYIYYDDLYEEKKLKFNLKKDNNKPFKSFITNYQSLFESIYNDNKKIKCFKKLRWFIIFDSDNYSVDDMSILSLSKDDNYNNDSFDEKDKDTFYNKFMNNDESLNIKNVLKDSEAINIDKDIMNKLLNYEDNQLLYFIKLIAITVTIFCRGVFGSMSSITNKNDSELINEYVERFNNFVQAASDINSKCENINVAMNYLDQEILKTYPHFVKFSIFRLFLKIWYNEMFSVLTCDNISFAKKLQNSIGKLFSKYIVNDLANTPDDKGLMSTLCSLSSHYEDCYMKYSVIEKGLNIINETFLDEYSVNLLELTNIDTNNYYDDMEKKIFSIIENSLRQILDSNIVLEVNKINYDMLIKKIENILDYFLNNFYSQRILVKLKYNIYSNVAKILKNIIYQIIFEEIQNMLLNDEQGDDLMELELNKKYLDEFNSFLTDNNSIFDSEEINKLLFKINNIDNIFDILSNIDIKLNKELEKMNKNDNKLVKILEYNNIPTSYNNLQRYLLSFSINNDWDVIRKIRSLENYHQKLHNQTQDNDMNGEDLDDLENLGNDYL